MHVHEKQNNTIVELVFHTARTSGVIDPIEYITKVADKFIFANVSCWQNDFNRFFAIKEVSTMKRPHPTWKVALFLSSF